jgi:hypothetical protein
MNLSTSVSSGFDYQEYYPRPPSFYKDVTIPARFTRDPAPINEELKSVSTTYKDDDEVISRKRIRSETDLAEEETPSPAFIPYSEFKTLLQRAKETDDPFLYLRDHFAENDKSWSSIIQFSEDIYLECKITWDDWDSTCFGDKREGKFKYIECFEHDFNTHHTDSNNQLLLIRITEDHQEGEWVSIHKSPKISGSQSKGIAEDISRAMKIKTCYLADCAETISKISKMKFRISIPLQIMNGTGYYCPSFMLCNKKIKSAIVIDEMKDSPDNFIMFNQNVKTHQSELAWARTLPVKVLHDEILNKKYQQLFRDLLKKHHPTLSRTKEKNDVFLQKCPWLFKDLVTELYTKSKNTKRALADYEWVYDRFLVHDNLDEETDIQNRFKNIIEKLFFDMLHSANFNQ